MTVHELASLKLFVAIEGRGRGVTNLALPRSDKRIAYPVVLRDLIPMESQTAGYTLSHRASRTDE